MRFYLFAATALAAVTIGAGQTGNNLQNFLAKFKQTTVTPITLPTVHSRNLVPSTTPLPITYQSKGCGFRQWRGMSRIASNGISDAAFGEFPWVVAIFRHNETVLTKYEYICVGSLIHPRVVLSVNHYFLESSRIRIRAGDWDISGDYEIRYHQSSDVDKIVGHPSYDPSNNAYDAALLFLNSRLTEAPNVGFACLPPPLTETPRDTICVVAGWGHETFFNGSIRNILKKVDLPKVDNDYCQSQLGNVMHRVVTLDRSMMCAGGQEGADACLKDGGAPLVCPYQGMRDRYYQAGIVSFGLRCGLPGVPGVYTNVAVVREWIDRTIQGRGYNIDTYLASP